MPFRIALVDLQVYERLTPLASGLMAAALLADSDRAASCRIDLQTWTVRAAADEIARGVLDGTPDLVAFSTYVWNARLVRAVVRRLIAARPELPVLLGGPHVVDQSARWHDEARSLLVANGEGEPILVDLVEGLLGDRSPADIAGITGRWRGDVLVGGRAAGAADLSQVPSPYLTGLFPSGRYTQAILETNRGCPFTCSFCFWGLGQKKVRRFEEDRVREEVRWLRRNNILSVFVADANFGMYPLDEEIAEALAAARRERGMPLMVSFNSMKNRPDRMVRIARIVGESGLATTQSMAIQSMDESALRRSGRGTIRTSAYAEALRQLEAGGFPTYVELIWPLPGETLGTFAEGIDALCRIGAQSFVVYPLLALPNTAILNDREEHGLVLTAAGDSPGDYTYVTATRGVSPDDYRTGLWIVLALNLLYNTRIMAGAARTLEDRGIRWARILRDFAEWARGQDDPLFTTHTDACEGVGHAAWAYWGGVAFQALHQRRCEVVALVERFARAQAWWTDEVHAALEVDRLLLPVLFADTPLDGWRGTWIAVRRDGGLLHAVLAPEAAAALARRTAGVSAPEVTVDPRRGQLPHFRSGSPETAYEYSYGQLQRVGQLLPTVTARNSATSDRDAVPSRHFSPGKSV